MKIYIAGKITGTSDYMERFEKAEIELTKLGYAVINPARVSAQLPREVSYWDYITLGLAMLDICDVIYLLKDWEYSQGATLEYEYAKSKGIKIVTQEVMPC